jgi:hypothetical protein
MNEVFLTLNEVFLRLFLSCMANAVVKLAMTGNGPYYSTLVVICDVCFLLLLLSVICVVLCSVYVPMCTVTG